MKPYFLDTDRQTALRQELASWKGTPFVPYMARKGTGVDCIRFAHAVMKPLGACGPVRWPRYAVTSQGASQLDLLCGCIEEAANVEQEPLDISCLIPGDVLIFSTGKALHHTGVFEGPSRFWHCLRGRKVEYNDLSDSTWTSHLYRVYRVMEES